MTYTNFKEKILNLLGKSKNGKISFLISYLHNRGCLPNLKQPKNLSEIWIKKVLDGEYNSIYYLADKYAVREYVKERGLAHLLTSLYGVYEKSDEIILSDLPDRFALKANFGCGMNIICTDKTQLNQDEVRKTVDKWLAPVHYRESEKHYELISRKVICESFIDDGSGGLPADYKFLCINGKAHCILGVTGREDGHGEYLPYTTDWEPLKRYFKKEPKLKNLMTKPANLNEMISVAERLADGIDLVRVDLYSNGKKIWFGEMTLTPAGCIFHKWSIEALNEMGEIYNKGHMK